MTLFTDLFSLKAKGTTAFREVIAGITTWATMVYIVVVNPVILADAGMEFGAAFMATCLATIVACLIMGAFANLPVALAPGMGLNAFFTYNIVLGLDVTWQVALGAVFWSGVLFLLLSLSGLRKRIIDAIPASLRTGIAIGIGLFLAVIGMQNAGLIRAGEGTLLELGDLHSWSAVLTAIGFIVIVALHFRGKSWAVIFGMALVSIAGWAFDPSAELNREILSLPPIEKTPFLELDLLIPLDVAFVAAVVALVFVDLFDTSGTLVAIAESSGMRDEDGNLPNLGRAMISDSSATVIGAVIGTSTTTSYIESTAGISEGGRTGLTAIVVALMFSITLFASPLAASIPSYASASALIFVAILLIGTLNRFEQWEDFSESAPLVLTAIIMPLGFSIADGIAIGVLTYVFIKVLAGRARDIDPILAALSVLFLVRFVLITEL